MKHGKHAAPKRSTTRQSGDRIDGITLMGGTANFGSGGVSISVAITGGTKASTSNFLATGAVGDSIAENAVFESARWLKSSDGSDVLAANALPAATTGSDYTVAVKYTLSGNGTSVDKTLTGTIAGRSVTAAGAASVTLS